jgi:hypothetical protein
MKKMKYNKKNEDYNENAKELINRIGQDEIESEVEDKKNKRLITIIIITLLVAMFLTIAPTIFRYLDVRNNIQESFARMHPFNQEGLDHFSNLMDSCKNKTEGDNCITKTYDGEVEGVCTLTEKNNTVCVPQKIE